MHMFCVGLVSELRLLVFVQKWWKLVPGWAHDNSLPLLLIRSLPSLAPKLQWILQRGLGKWPENLNNSKKDHQHNTHIGLVKSNS